MARIRDDFEGGIWAQGVDEFGRINLMPTWLVAGDEVPDGVAVSAEHLAGGEGATDGGAASTSPPAGGRDGDGQGKDVTVPAVADLPNMSELTVDEVNSWLEDRPAEVVRAVLDAEIADRNRAGIVNGPAARHLSHGA